MSRFAAAARRTSRPGRGWVRVLAGAALLSAACAALEERPYRERRLAPLVRPTRPEAVTLDRAPSRPRILCVVAHPDDELAFGGLLYKSATHLGGRCDVAVITNGEGGYKYSTLAEAVYGLPLTEETVGREHLPRLRAEELAAGCALLGVRALYHLDQTDHRYTTDPMEVLAPEARVWDLARVGRALDAILARGDYDFVLTLAPTTTTHGHHQAATLLALEAVARLPAAARPAVLCASTSSANESPPELEPRAAFPALRTVPGARYRFDRLQPFGYRERLDYRIVVNWAIAEHKSQGTMQLLVNHGEHEHYRLFAGGPPEAEARCAALFDALAEPQFAPLTYDTPSSGTR